MPAGRQKGLRQFEHLPARELYAQLGRLGVISSSVRPADGQESATELLERLVSAGEVTAFQSQLIKQGKSEHLLVGSYLILDRIGAGGMGQVFKSRHRSMNRIVALKLLQPRLLRNEHAVQRFYREVEAAARLHHPQIVAAYDAGCSNGQHFLAMEYVDGVDLATLVRRSGPLACETALGYLSQSLEGLAYAHANGIIHRDLKPANLLLSTGGSVKILDMGLARIERDGGPNEQQLTGDSTLLGTVDFMSPEQGYDPSSAGARSDLYSLGCSLFWMITGSPPYARGSVPATLLAHQRDPIPSVRAVFPQMPVAIDDLLVRALAKDPDERFQSASEFRRAMEEVAGQIQGQPVGKIRMQGSLKDDSRFAATMTGGRDRTQVDVARRRRGLARRNLTAIWLTTAIVTLCLLAVTVLGIRSYLADSTTPANDEHVESRKGLTTGDSAEGKPDTPSDRNDGLAVDPTAQLRDQLFAVPASEVPAVCRTIAQASSSLEFQRSLNRSFEDKGTSDPDRLRSALALMVLGDNRMKNYLAMRVMDSSVEEFELIVTTLVPPSGELLEALWNRVTAEEVEPAEHLRVYEALACWDPENAEWEDHHSVFAEHSALSGTSLPATCAAFGHQHLMPYWLQWAKGPDETLLAAASLKLVLEQQAPDVQLVMSILPHVGTERWRMLVPVFQAFRRDESQWNTISQNLRHLCTDDERPEVRINALAMLWATGETDACVEILVDSESEERDPQHEQLVHAFLVDDSGIFPTTSVLQLCENVDELSEEKMELALRAIGVREFFQESAPSLGTTQKQTVYAVAEKLFVEASTARAHATATWYLQRAGRESNISELRDRLRKEHALLSVGQLKNRSWYIAECGLTMVVFTELNLAVSMTEIPASLFVFQQQVPPRKASDTATAALISGPPQVNVDWVEAVEFTMWLNESTEYLEKEFAFSKRAIIANVRKSFEDQVDEVIDDPQEKASVIALGNGRPSRNAARLTKLFDSFKSRGKRGNIPHLMVRLPVDERKGYRLPTVEEWREISDSGRRRGGTGRQHEWSRENANGTAHPIGMLFSDRNGLFDLQGNVTEWCLDGQQGDVPFSSQQPVAGSSFQESAVLHNSALVRSYPVLERAPQIGFRVVRRIE